MKRSFLEEVLPKLETHANSGEIYITDLVKAADKADCIIETTVAPFDLVRGVNTLQELAVAENIKQQEIITYFMTNGTRLVAPHTLTIDATVRIGKDTTIAPGVQLRNGTTIGDNCSIDSYCILDNAHLQDHARVKAHSVLTNITLQAGTQVGPFAYNTRGYAQQAATLLCLTFLSTRLIKVATR